MNKQTDTLDAGPRGVAAQSLPARLLLGFLAGSLSVLIFSSGAIAILHAAGLVALVPWDTSPVAPFGVPQIVSAAFWGGLWGGLYALLEPRLTGRLGWWLGGLLFGAVLPVLVVWFVVLPLKGAPVGGGFELPMVLVVLFLHAVFGLGAAIVFRIGRPLAGRRLRPLPSAD